MYFQTLNNNHSYINTINSWGERTIGCYKNIQQNKNIIILPLKVFYSRRSEGNPDSPTEGRSCCELLRYKRLPVSQDFSPTRAAPTSPRSVHGKATHGSWLQVHLTSWSMSLALRLAVMASPGLTPNHILCSNIISKYLSVSIILDSVPHLQEQDL